MPVPARTARDGLLRTDDRSRARLRALALAASAAGTDWTVRALAEVMAGEVAGGARPAPAGPARRVVVGA